MCIENEVPEVSNGVNAALRVGLRDSARTPFFKMKKLRGEVSVASRRRAVLCIGFRRVRDSQSFDMLPLTFPGLLFPARGTTALIKEGRAESTLQDSVQIEMPAFEGVN